MSTVSENKDRRVVPNWREFYKTVHLGELNFHQNAKITSGGISPNIVEYVEAWRSCQTLVYAGELVSAAVSNNSTIDQDVLRAADYILENKTTCTVSQRSLALAIKRNLKFTAVSRHLQNALGPIDKNKVFKLIHETRAAAQSFESAIKYVELSRYYSMLGLKEKAANTMKIALHLGPDSRFVLRSASRLFVHNADLQLAHDILKRHPKTIQDPWLMSAEIAVSMMQGRSSKFLKQGLTLMESRSISDFDKTELASSLATQELIYGSLKKSKTLFGKALQKPNDNTLAQVEWASRKGTNIEINPSEYEVEMNYEAIAINNYYNYEFKEAVENGISWFNDMPYSKRPILFASHIACAMLKDYGKAIEIAKNGLLSHPNDPDIINNLAYCLGLSDLPEDADCYLNKIKPATPMSEVTEICLQATKGLINFRLKNFELGRKLYHEAFDRTNTPELSALHWKAILNYAKEEIRQNTEKIGYAIGLVASMPPISSNNIEIEILKKDLISDLQRHDQSAHM